MRGPEKTFRGDPAAAARDVLKNRSQVGAVYGAGLLQGLALVTFPAASAIFTSPHVYALSNAEYGGLFVPQTIMAIAAALLGGRLAGRWGGKRELRGTPRACYSAGVRQEELVARSTPRRGICADVPSL